MNELVKTKTFWGGLSAIGFGIVLCANGNMNEGILSIFAGVQTIFLRDAIQKR